MNTQDKQKFLLEFVKQMTAINPSRQTLEDVKEYIQLALVILDAADKLR